MLTGKKGNYYKVKSNQMVVAGGGGCCCLVKQVHFLKADKLPHMTYTPNEVKLKILGAE